MDHYLRLIYQLPAIIAGTTMVAYLLPVKVPPRFAPLLLFITGLIVLMLPEFIDMALALTIPVAWIQSKLGIDLHSHEPLKITVPKIRLPKKLQIQQFVTQAYPDPEAEPAAQEAGEHEDAPPPELEPGDTVSTVPSFVPRL